MYTAVNDRAWYYGRRTGRALGTIVHNRYRWGAFNWADAAAVGTSPFAVRLRSAATSFPGRSACGPLRSPVVFSRIEALRIPFMTMRDFALFERCERRPGAGTAVTAAAFGWPPARRRHHQNPGLPDRCNRRGSRHPVGCIGGSTPLSAHKLTSTVATNK